MSKKERVDVETGEILSAEAFVRSYGLRPTRLNDRGRELLDSTPMAPPVGYKPQPSMVEIIRAQIVSEKLAREAEELGLETFEEADDFDVEDDYDPSTPYEEMFDPEPPSPRYETAQETLDRRPDRPAKPRKPAVEAQTSSPATTPAPSPSRAPEALAKPLTATDPDNP